MKKTILNKVESAINKKGKIPLFLSHGLFHIFLAIVLIAMIIALLVFTNQLNKSKPRRISVKTWEYANNKEMRRRAELTEYWLHLYLEGFEKYGISNPAIVYIPTTVNRDKGYMDVTLVDEKGRYVTPDETKNHVFNTFTQVEIKVPELKEAMVWDDEASNIHYADINGSVYLWSVDIHPVSKDDEVFFKTYYIDDINNYKFLHKAKYTVTSRQLFKDVSYKNPYVDLYLQLDDILLYDSTDIDIRNPKSEIQISLDSVGPTFSQIINAPYTIARIYPLPNQVMPNMFGYIGNDAVREVLANGGIYMQIYDIKAKAEADRLLLLGSILIGLLFGILLDVVVELFHKWKKLA